MNGTNDRPLHPLACPLSLPNGMVIPNRLAKAAMSECLGDRKNAPTNRHTTLYRRFAAGGAGLIITGNVMVDRRALGEVGNVVVDDDRDMEHLRAWSAAARSGGAVALVQLNHPGRQVLAGMGMHPVAPSGIRVKGAAGFFLTPRELSGSEIEEVVEKFATAAAISIRAGFGGVEIHAAHGYLINQFLSPLTNHRTDHWGGDIAGRSRFLLEVVRTVRSAIGSANVLAVKLNSADFQRGGFERSDAATVAGMLGDEGIDLLEISGGTYESTAFMGVTSGRPPVRESTRSREAYFLEFAEQIRPMVDVPLMLSGGFRTATGMADAVGSGAVDLVGLARPLVVQPDLPQRILDGHVRASDARPRRLGIPRTDGMTDLMWHTTQLQRMGSGKEPLPDRHPLITLAQYGRHFVPYTVSRLLKARS